MSVNGKRQTDRAEYPGVFLRKPDCKVPASLQNFLLTDIILEKALKAELDFRAQQIYVMAAGLQRHQQGKLVVRRVFILRIRLLCR